MSNTDFLDYVIDLLSPLYPVKARKLFGGYGLYIDNKIFAIIEDHELYLKYNNKISEYFTKLDLEYFSYERKGKTIKMSYWKVPPEILEDQESLSQCLRILSESI